MQLMSYINGRLSLSALSLGILAFSGVTIGAPVSQNGNALTRRDCEYGERLTLADYTAYLQKWYPATDHYLLYSGNSQAQAINFQGANTERYYYYDDFFDSSRSEHYLTEWPRDKNGCYRPDDGEASSIAIAKVAAGNVLVFGAVEYQTKGQTSFFKTKELPELQAHIPGSLRKITHMLRDATKASEVLATEDGSGNISFTDGHSKGESNASGSFGDCSSTLEPPTCDIPSGGKGH